MRRYRSVVGGLEAQQVAVGAGFPPGAQLVVAPFAQAEGDGQPGLGLDAPHHVAHPLGLEAVVFAGLQHHRPVTELEGVVGAGQDLVRGHAVAFDLAIAGPHAAVGALADAVVGDLDEAAQMHLVAHVGAPGLVGHLPQFLQDGWVGLLEPAHGLFAA